MKLSAGDGHVFASGWVTERDWNQGTTNLHLDISDACNLMVYVGIPEDEPPESQEALIKVRMC